MWMKHQSILSVKKYFFGFVLYFYTTSALATPSCQFLFTDKPSLLSARPVNTSVEQYINTKGLGYLPILSSKIINATNNYSFYAYHPTKKDRDGNQVIVGEFHYGLAENDTILEIDLVLIAPEAKQNHIATALYAKVLQEHPLIREIRSHLVSDNYQIIRQALIKGADLVNAVKNSPAYKSMERLGFTKISLLNYYPNSAVELNVQRPD